MTRQLPQGSLISYMSTMVKENGGINLAQGLPGYEPPSELIRYLIEVAPEPIHQYPPGIGNFKILHLLEEHYSKISPFSLDNFLITQGATEAISLLYLYLKQLIGNNFSVMAFGPAYESYSQLPVFFGQPFFEGHLTSDGGFDPEDTEKMIRDCDVKIFFAASPSNPYGRIMPQKYVEKLIEICRRNNCYLIFDAVYRELYFDAKPFIPVEHIGSHVFYVNSFSKLLSITGWRVGYLITSREHMQKIRRMHDYTGLCANSVLQEAIARYLQNHNMGMDYVSTVRNKIHSTFIRMSHELINLGFKIPVTDGGYFIWSELPDGFDDGFETAIDFYEKTKVATVPGIHFSKQAKKYIRFNIARPDEDIDRAITAVKQYFS